MWYSEQQWNTHLWQAQDENVFFVLNNFKKKLQQDNGFTLYFRLVLHRYIFAGIVAESGQKQLQINDMKDRVCQLNASRRIFLQETSSSDWTQVADTTETEQTVDSITPCTSFDFAVSAVLGGEETERYVIR